MEGKVKLNTDIYKEIRTGRSHNFRYGGLGLMFVTGGVPVDGVTSPAHHNLHTKTQIHACVLGNEG